jgi:hypothetical protein
VREERRGERRGEGRVDRGGGERGEMPVMSQFFFKGLRSQFDVVTLQQRRGDNN